MSSRRWRKGGTSTGRTFSLKNKSSESPFFDEEWKVPVSGRDHANVYMVLPFAAHRANCAGLKNPQELRRRP